MGQRWWGFPGGLSVNRYLLAVIFNGYRFRKIPIICQDFICINKIVFIHFYMMKTLADLDVYQEGLRLFLKVHPVSFKLPKSELYELGSQLRRSADSVVTNIVEGYGRNKYKSDFIKFLTYSKASNLETLHHLEKLTKLYPELEDELSVLRQEYDRLGAMLYKFISYVSINWNTKPLTTN